MLFLTLLPTPSLHPCWSLAFPQIVPPLIFMSHVFYYPLLSNHNVTVLNKIVRYILIQFLKGKLDFIKK